MFIYLGIIAVETILLVFAAFFIFKLKRQLKQISGPMFVLRHSDTFKDILGQVKYFVDKEFESLYRLHLQPADLTGISLTEHDLSVIRKAFCKNTINRMGPNIFGAFTLFIGSEENAVRFLMYEFEIKLLDNRVFSTTFKEEVLNIIQERGMGSSYSLINDIIASTYYAKKNQMNSNNRINSNG